MDTQELDTADPAPPGAIPIAVVDDHYLVREGLCAALRAIGGYEVVLCVETGEQYMALHADHAPAAIALVDMRSCGANGTELLAWLKAEQPGTRVLATSTEHGLAQLRKAYLAGACGFLPKNIGPHDLRTALADVCVKGSYHHPALMREHVLALGQVDKAAALHFTGRELDVGRLLCAREEFTVAQVADRLGISASTVNTHRKQLYKKLKVHSICGLVRELMDRGLL